MTDSIDRDEGTTERLDTLERRNDRLERETDRLKRENQQLRERLNAIEEQVRTDAGTDGRRATVTDVDLVPSWRGNQSGSTAVTANAVSSDYKVRGEKTAPGGTGVQGHNTATTGTATGVEGVTESSAPHAAGVHGQAAAGSGVTYGVLGSGGSPSSQGVVGVTTTGQLPDLFPTYPAGVWGHTDRSGAEADVSVAYGVRGYASAQSGAAHGVTGATASTDGYGVLSLDDSKTQGTHEVDRLSQQFVGASVEISSTQTIDPNEFETVRFDSENFDRGNEFDTTNHEFSPGMDGIYHANVWARTDQSGRLLYLQLYNGGSRIAQANPDGSDSLLLSRWFQLTSSDTLSVAAVSQDSTDSIDIVSADASFVRVG